MEPRINKEQTDRRQRQVQVPERTGVSLRQTPTIPTQSKPIIPLLDEEKRDLKSPVFIEHIQRVGRKLAASPKKLAIVVLLLVTVGYTGTLLMQKKNTVTDIKGAATTATNETDLERNAKPKFPTVIPSGKSIEKLGGWTRISPEGRVPVYAYADKLSGIAIRVSEQELPANLEGDSEGVQKLAADFDATQKLTAGDTTAYIGTSAKGPQSVIFTKNKLLILITSDKKIDTEHWTTYISSLQ